MRRSTSAPMAMAGKPKSAWPASSGGMAMEDHTAPPFIWHYLCFVLHLAMARLSLVGPQGHVPA
jgi:hypothetical protein